MQSVGLPESVGDHSEFTKGDDARYTNHYSELDRGSQAGGLLRERLISRGEQPWLTVMTAEEVLRGRLAQVAADKDRLLVHYDLFLNGLLTLAKWRFLPWTQTAQDAFDMLHFQRVRIGTMDRAHRQPGTDARHAPAFPQSGRFSKGAGPEGGELAGLMSGKWRLGCTP
jgi:hypothetical protein